MVSTTTELEIYATNLLSRLLKKALFHDKAHVESEG